MKKKKVIVLAILFCLVVSVFVLPIPRNGEEIQLVKECYSLDVPMFQIKSLLSKYRKGIPLDVQDGEKKPIKRDVVDGYYVYRYEDGSAYRGIEADESDK